MEHSIKCTFDNTWGHGNNPGAIVMEILNLYKLYFLAEKMEYLSRAITYSRIVGRRIRLPRCYVY